MNSIDWGKADVNAYLFAARCLAKTGFFLYIRIPVTHQPGTLLQQNVMARVGPLLTFTVSMETSTHIFKPSLLFNPIVM